MEKRINHSGIVIVLLAVALVAMSVGFAVFSTTLNFNGEAQVSSSSWRVELDESSYEETEGSVSPSSAPTINTTSMTYNVTLAKPTDFYEFTIDVKNLGTFDANLKSITMSDISTHSNYLKYTVTYKGQEYTQTTPDLSIPLTAGSGVETVKVRVEYIQPADSSQLPSSPQNVTLTTSLDYEQVAA